MCLKIRSEFLDLVLLSLAAKDGRGASCLELNVSAMPPRSFIHWSTIVSKCVLALTSIYVIWKIYLVSCTHNWYAQIHFASGYLSPHNIPVLPVLAFFFQFLASVFGIIQLVFYFIFGKQVLLNMCQGFAEKFAATFGLCFMAGHFCFAYLHYSLAWFQGFMLLMVICSICALPAKLTKIINISQQTIALLSIMIVSFAHQNWQGVLGAQFIALSVLSIGTEGNLFNFPSIDGFHYMLACATYLLFIAVISIEQ